MAAPRQMTSKTLNALKGWPQPAAVDFHAEFDATLAAIEVLPGSVVRLGSNGKYLQGVGNLKVMPLFMFNGSKDPDVINEGGDAAVDKGVFVPINPTGQAMALVAVGAYELVSTAFVSDTYAPNDALTSASSGGNAGLLSKGTMWTNMIVGIVSRGIVDNGYGHNALAFWPFPVFPNP